MLPCEFKWASRSSSAAALLIHRLPCCISSFITSAFFVTSDDSSRVKLSIIHGSPYDDYINANYMPVRTDAPQSSSSVIPSSSVNIITGACSVAFHQAHSEHFNAVFHIDVWDSPGKNDACVVLYNRVTTPGRSSLQLRVLCLPPSKISGEWSGRRTCRLWSCWHAATNKDEWAATQTQHPDCKQNSLSVTPYVCFRSNVSSTGI